MAAAKKDQLFAHIGDETQKASIPPASCAVMPAEQDFSLVLGGPLFQLLRRAHLSGDAPTLVRKRIIIISMFVWLPLLMLSAMEGQLLGDKEAVPFLMDVEVHIRFLVALPLLILAELLVHQRMHTLVALLWPFELVVKSMHIRTFLLFSCM